MFSTGTCLSLVRIIDPYYRHIIKVSILELFGFVIDEYDKNKKKNNTKPLNNYLAESLNLELINIILQGVSGFAEPDYKTIKRMTLGKNEDFYESH